MAKYQGKNVTLNKPKRGGSKKSYVYVKDGNKVKKVSFGPASVIYIPIEERSGAHWILDRVRFNRRIDALEVQMKKLNDK